MSIISALPNTFTNGTTADATQVNANFNQIVSNVNANAAAGGANADISSMSQLATVSHYTTFSAGVSLNAMAIFLAKSSAGTLIGLSDTLVPFGTIVQDNLSNWNGGSNAYVCSVAGRYQINWCMRTTSVNANDNMGSELWINGSRLVDGTVGIAPVGTQGCSSGGGITLDITGTITTVQLYAKCGGTAQNMTAVATNNWLSIVRVG